MPKLARLSNRSQPTKLMTALLPSTYSFECPHCRSILSLPLELEGVTGPCPHCQSTITAPPRQTPPTAYLPTFPPPPQHQQVYSPPLVAPVPATFSAPPFTPPPAPTSAPALVPTWMDLVGDSETAPPQSPSPVQPFPADAIPFAKGSEAPDSPPSPSWVLRIGMLAGIVAAAFGVYLLFHPPAGDNAPGSPPSSAVVETVALALDPPSVVPDGPSIPQTPVGELPPDEDLPGPTSPVIPRIESTEVPTPDSASPTPEPPSTKIETPEIRRAQIQPTPGLLIVPDPDPAAPGPAASPLEPSADPPSPSLLEEPRAALETFLAAANWPQRLPLIQHADKLRPQITNYYTTHSDGSVKTESVDFLTSQPTPKGSEVFYLFNVQMRGGHAFPVAVEKMDGRYRIDWESFVEFKDLLLPEFFKTYSPEPASFHVVLERKHYFGTDVPNQDRKLCFSVEPPVPGFSNYAWVSDSDLQLITKLGVRAEFGQTSYPVVTLRWVKETNGTAYVILEKICSDNWRSDILDEPSSEAAPAVEEKPQDKSATPSAPRRARIIK